MAIREKCAEIDVTIKEQPVIQTYIHTAQSVPFSWVSNGRERNMMKDDNQTEERRRNLSQNMNHWITRIPCKHFEYTSFYYKFITWLLMMEMFNKLRPQLLNVIFEFFIISIPEILLVIPVGDWFNECLHFSFLFYTSPSLSLSHKLSSSLSYAWNNKAIDSCWTPCHSLNIHSISLHRNFSINIELYFVCTWIMMQLASFRTSNAWFCIITMMQKVNKWTYNRRCDATYVWCAHSVWDWTALCSASRIQILFFGEWWCNRSL